jgi:hypothetical protein
MIAGHLTEDFSAQFMSSKIQRFFGAHYVPKTDRANEAVGRFILYWCRQSLTRSHICLPWNSILSNGGTREVLMQPKYKDPK